MLTDPKRAYASMGNYVFETDLLSDTLLEDSRRSTEHDFGRTIIPELFLRQPVFAYGFLEHGVPGVKPYEEPGYWRDVGTLKAYWDAHMDLLGATPVFNLQNKLWPILGGVYDGAPMHCVGGELRNALIGEGCHIEEGKIVHSVLGRGVDIGKGAEITDSVIMDAVEIGAGARLNGVIVDRFNVVPDGTQIGTGSGQDERRFFRDSSGLVVLERGETGASI